MLGKVIIVLTLLSERVKAERIATVASQDHDGQEGKEGQASHSHCKVR
jgi:hypothetical protein